MARLAESISKELAVIRQINKESLGVIAERMGTDTKQVWRLEKGKGNPYLRSIERYAEALGYTIHFSFVKNA